MKLITYGRQRITMPIMPTMRFFPAALLITAMCCGTWIYIYVESEADLKQPTYVYTATPEKDCQNEANSNGDTGKRIWTQQLYKQSSLPPILGNRSTTKKFLSIGIASVYREENYLEKTLNSFILQTYPDERENAVVIVYLADTDPENKEKQLNLIEAKFRPYLDSGFIQVIGSSPDIYPSMNFALTKRTFNDTVDRVLWRTKQVVDFAFLFSYIKSQAEYHIVVEDDVIVAPQFITAIQDYVEEKQNERWIALHFSQFLGIGLLFHARELPRLSQFLIMFHQDQPVDMLLRKYIQIENSERDIMRRDPSIFQHIGIQSTLPNKVQKLTDRTFNIAQRRLRNRNPKIVNTVSSMRIYKEHGPRYAYAGTSGYFWGMPSKAVETFDVVFQEPTVISRLVIISGLLQNSITGAVRDTPKDIIEAGRVEVSQHFSSVSDSEALCDDFTVIGNFTKGEVDLQTNLTDIRCLRLKIATPQQKWIIIREIQVFQ